MAVRPIDEYPGKVSAPTADYPDGKAQNITSPGDGTGTPWEAKFVNDVFGFQQFLTSEAGITPSGTPDNATASQYFDAIWKLLNVRSVTHDITADANYTLTADQNLYTWLTITDTGVLLTTGRDIIIDAIGRMLLFTNSTAQELTVKVSGGTGVAIPAGVTSILVSNGTDVSLLQTATPVSDYDLVNKKFVLDNAGTAGALTINNFLHIQDQKTSGINGGSGTVATYNTRDLNTVITNTITGASLSSNQIILPAGTYFTEVSAPAYRVSGHRIKLYNITDVADELLGLSAYAPYISADVASQTDAKIYGQFTVLASKTFEIQHYIQSATIGTTAFGSPVSSGDVEIYTDVKIWKVG